MLGGWCCILVTMLSVGANTATQDASSANKAFREWGWISTPVVDVVSAFAWLPVFVVAHVLRGDNLRVWAAAVFLFSLVHQAITPLLLATDKPTRSKHRVVYALGIPAVLLGSFLLVKAGLTWMAVVAAGWNLIHTLRQRYGIVRLYGRNAGQDRQPIEQGLIFAPFLMTAALVVWIPNTLNRIESLGFGGINQEILDGVRIVSPIAPVLFVAAASWCVWVAWRLYTLRANRPPSPAKRVYLASYALSLVVSVLDPAAGLIALVAAHSFEYFFALDATLGKRFGAPGTELHRLIKLTGHRRVFLFLVGLLCGVGLVVLGKALSASVYLLLYMTVGGSHFLFDGFMWKGDKPPPVTSVS
jgi:hypothetical protein